MSIWLPVGRANFYSSTANGWLLTDRPVGGLVQARSGMLARSGYVPRLQVSVLRRLLEVLPTSFGYEEAATCETNSLEIDDLARPVAVTLTLRPKPAPPDGPERLANLGLVRAGVDEVTLHVDEHGGYTFTARAQHGTDRVKEALKTHILEVFGGDYSLDRRSDHARRKGGADNGGRTAIRRYNGVDPNESVAKGKPRGILNFFQLNTIAEGLFNESLSPAVFFEQNGFLKRFMADARRTPGALTLVEHMRQVIELLVVDGVDARKPSGLVIALRRFLDVTAREVLQKLKWSVESIRRSLLDESVGMLHRQSKLVQLDLGALFDEQTPELAEGASESQLRGYVLLAAAKLPLIANVHDIAVLAKDYLRQTADPGAVDIDVDGPGRGRGWAGTDVDRLATQLVHWRTLLRGLRSNVRGLESAIEHAWRESLLYEQQQVRREQEAMAEIGRSRAGRPPDERQNMNAYNIATLLFTVVAVLIAVREGNILNQETVSTDWRTWARALSPILLVAIIFTGIVPFYYRRQRKRREKEGHAGTYPYEFAFWLEEAASPSKVFAYLGDNKARAIKNPVLKELTITNQGGGRVERVSQHRALIKIHSIATFKVPRRDRDRAKASYAKFEIVNEILAHRVSGRPTFMIIQCRVFGDSPRPLGPGQVLELTRAVLNDAGTNLTGHDEQRKDPEGIDVDDVIELIKPLFSERADDGDESTGERETATGGEPTTVPIPAQRPASRTPSGTA